MRKIRTHHKHVEGRVFSWVVLMSGFSVGMLLPILPNFVQSIVGSESAVSLFYSIMAITLFFGAILSTIIFKKVERTLITKISLLISAVSFFFLIFVSQIVELAILEVLKGWFTLFLMISLSLFVRDFSDDESIGEEEGVFYRYHNLGLLFGPLLGGFLAANYGYEINFIIAAGIIFIALAYFYHKHVIRKSRAIINSRKTTSTELIRNVKKFFSNKNRRKAYLITLAMMGWVSFRRIYIPLYVVLLGFKENMTGIIFALSMIPLILLEVKVGKYADKNNLRKPITLGFLIIGLLLIGVFISPFPLINFALLILVGVGQALVEPLQEVILFKNLKESEEDHLFGVYMTSDPLAYFLVPALGVLIFAFLPFEYIFLIFGGGAVLLSYYFWITLKDL